MYLGKLLHKLVRIRSLARILHELSLLLFREIALFSSKETGRDIFEHCSTKQNRLLLHQSDVRA